MVKKYKKIKGPKGWHVSGGGGGKKWKGAGKKVVEAVKNVFKRKRPKKSKTKTKKRKELVASPRYLTLENTYSAKTLKKYGYKVKKRKK